MNKYEPPIEVAKLTQEDFNAIKDAYLEWQGENVIDNDEWRQNYALMAAFLMLPGHYTEQ
jgi:hypothetical protein